MPPHILIIENHPDNQRLMAYLLERSGYQVSLASTGEEGIETALNAEFDLILCDICMPGIDGYEVARRLKADTRYAKTPLVAVTAMLHPSDHDRILAAGFNGYAAKATAPHQFLEYVRGFLLTPTGPAKEAQHPAPAKES